MGFSLEEALGDSQGASDGTVQSRLARLSDEARQAQPARDAEAAKLVAYDGGPPSIGAVRDAERFKRAGGSFPGIIDGPADPETGGGVRPVNFTREAPASKPASGFSLEEALGMTAPRTMTGEEFINPPEKRQEEPKGFLANLKNPLNLWLKESLPAHIYTAIADHTELWRKAEMSRTVERRDKALLAYPNANPRAALEAKQREQAREEARFSFGKLAEGFQEDPGKFGAEFVNGFVADPWMALSVFGGLGGGVTRAGAKAAGAVGKAAGRAVEGGAAGAYTNAIIGTGKQEATEGRVTPEQLIDSAIPGFTMGAAMAPGFGLLGDMWRGRGRAIVPANDIRVTDTKQLFKDDEAHAAWEQEWKTDPANDVAPKPRIKLKSSPEQIGRQVEEELTPAREEALNKAPYERTPEEQADLHKWRNSWLNTPQATMLAAGGMAAALVMMDEQMRDTFGPYAAASVLIRKPPGGQWHPQAVERLAGSIFPKLGAGEAQDMARIQQHLAETGGGRAEEVSPTLARFQERAKLADWSTKAVSRYLNKHAGTENDPLKDIVLPSGKTWEEVTDSAFWGGKPADHVGEQGLLAKGVPATETVWTAGDSLLPRQGDISPTRATQELSDHLSHVGDFLRQNVPADKLPQYDLVRAVKETSTNDARVAKEMEKARSASTAQLPVHKEYPNGMKWVQIELPEKLTAEQRKGVQDLGDIEFNPATATVFDKTPQQHNFVAVDGKGKPVKNSYTEEFATGKTPQMAWLAGRLAEEGNTMGHCVGGYCEGVASGESKIYSLRDAKGESHVTVEVTPPSQYPLSGEKLFQRFGEEGKQAWNAYRKARDDYDPMGHDLAEFLKNRYPDLWERMGVGPNSITQIKGKQNRAPDGKYLPYVQDFVKGGKWGEVGDLVNTGLHNIDKAWPEGSPGGARIRARFPDQKLLTQEEIDIGFNTKLPLNDLEHLISAKHPLVELTLQEHPSGVVEVVDIGKKTPEQLRGRSDITLGQLLPEAQKGIGQKALAETTLWADANNRDMMLMAQPNRGSTMPLAKLVEIYKRHGFEPGPEQPYDDAVMMYRSPKQGAQSDVNAQSAPGSQVEEQGPPAIRPARAQGPVEGGGGAAGQPDAGPRLPPGQEGGAAIKFILGLGAAGAGSLLGSQLMADHPIRGSIIGAMGGIGLLYLMPAARGLAVMADPMLGLVSTRISNISPSLGKITRDAEREIMRDTSSWITRGSSFLSALRKHDDPELNRAINSNDKAAIKTALEDPAVPGALRQGWIDTRNILKEIGGRLKEAGLISNVLDGYFPRIVKDREGLLNWLGGELKTDLQKKLDDAQLASKASGGLTSTEESAIINKWLQEQMRGRGAPGFTKGRKLADISMEMNDFYYPPHEAFPMYVESAAAALSRAKMFGKAAVKGEGGLDVDASIGALLNPLLKEGKIIMQQMEEARSLLQARYMPEKGVMPAGASRFLSNVKTLGYAGLLGNVASAATQIGDTALSIYAQGLLPAIAGVARKLTGNSQVTARDLGVTNIVEEFRGNGMPQRILDFGLKWSGFQMIDRFGKDVLVQSTFSKYTSLAKTEKGRAEIAKKYGEAYGNELPKLLDDLQAGRRSDSVDSLLFSELSDMQPINRLEVPEAYLRNPNGRNLYMLHTFMLKQADIIRRDGYNEMKAGTMAGFARGSGNILKYAMVLTIAGVPTTLVKDWIDNKPMGNSLLGYMDNVFKTFGWSQYTVKEAMGGHPVKAALSTMAPPYEMFDDIATANPKAMRYIPLLGRPIYNHFFDKEGYKQGEKDIAKRDREVRNALEGSAKARKALEGK